MTELIPSSRLVLPTIAIDSRSRVLTAVVSEHIIGVCMVRLGDEVLTPDTYSRRLREEPWATLVRARDGLLFVTVSGLLPSESDPAPVLDRADRMEAAHIAIEIGLASWPEWGEELRDRFTPKQPLPVHLAGVIVEA